MIEEECVKCGNDKADMEYFGHVTDISVFTPIGGSLQVRHSTILSNKEAIKLTCTRCRYVWVEKPLDKKKRDDDAYGLK